MISISANGAILLQIMNEVADKTRVFSEMIPPDGGCRREVFSQNFGFG